MDNTPIVEEADQSVLKSIRIALGVLGLVSLITGALILIWPDHTAMIVGAIIAGYAAVAGLVNLGIGIFSGKLGLWTRIGYLALGVVFLAAAGVAFANLGPFVIGLAVFFGIFIGIAWIVEGVVSFFLLFDSSSKVWTALYAVISIIAGSTLLAAPLWGAELLWLVLGVSLVFTGVVQVVRAVRFARS